MASNSSLADLLPPDPPHSNRTLPLTKRPILLGSEESELSNEPPSLAKIDDNLSSQTNGDLISTFLSNLWPEPSNSSQLDTDSSSIAPSIVSDDFPADWSSSLNSSTLVNWSNFTASNQSLPQLISPVLVEPSPPAPTMAPTPSGPSLSTLATNFMNTLLNPNKGNNHLTSPRPSSPEVFIYDGPTSAESEESIDSNVTSFFGNRATMDPSTTAIFNEDGPLAPSCYSSPEDYELFTSMLCSSLLVLGVVYFLYGYRCFRAVAFFTGLVFGTALAYAVCTAEHLVDIPYGNLIVALSAGLMIGLLTMLVTYIGLFVIGMHLGLLLGVALLSVIYLLRPFYNVLQPPLSALTLLIFFVAVGLVGAFSTIYFSKGCTIIASSLYGSALSLLCADYFLENLKIVHWFLDQLSSGNDWYGLLSATQRGLTLCLGSHIILGLWPVLALLGILIQGCVTGRGVQLLRTGYGEVASTPSSMVLRSGHTDITSTSRDPSIRGKSPEESCLEQKHRKYRYLYQVRTAHGDVISQHYFQSMQNNKKLCLPDQDSFTFNSDLSSHFLPESRTTTLSVA